MLSHQPPYSGISLLPKRSIDPVEVSYLNVTNCCNAKFFEWWAKDVRQYSALLVKNTHIFETLNPALQIYSRTMDKIWVPTPQTIPGLWMAPKFGGQWVQKRGAGISVWSLLYLAIWTLLKLGTVWTVIFARNTSWKSCFLALHSRQHWQIFPGPGFSSMTVFGTYCVHY